MTFSFHPRAEQELDKAVCYYEECSSGLGLEFAEEVYAAIARIIAYPKAWTRLSKHTRRCLVNRFPFGVIFQVKDSVLTSNCSCLSESEARVLEKKSNALRDWRRRCLSPLRSPQRY